MSKHYGNPTRQGRLKLTLDFLLYRGEQGATRYEIRKLTGAEAVNSDIDELRSWIRDSWPGGDSPYVIPPAKFEGISGRGGRIYRYFAYKKSPQITADEHGQLVMA